MLYWVGCIGFICAKFKVVSMRALRVICPNAVFSHTLGTLHLHLCMGINLNRARTLNSWEKYH